MSNLPTSKELMRYLYNSPTLHLHRQVVGWYLVHNYKTSKCGTNQCVKLPLFGVPKGEEVPHINR